MLIHIFKPLLASTFIGLAFLPVLWGAQMPDDSHCEKPLVVAPLYSVQSLGKWVPDRMGVSRQQEADQSWNRERKNIREQKAMSESIGVALPVIHEVLYQMGKSIGIDFAERLNESVKRIHFYSERNFERLENNFFYGEKKVRAFVTFRHIHVKKLDSVLEDRLIFQHEWLHAISDIRVIKEKGKSFYTYGLERTNVDVNQASNRSKDKVKIKQNVDLELRFIALNEAMTELINQQLFKYIWHEEPVLAHYPFKLSSGFVNTVPEFAPYQTEMQFLDRLIVDIARRSHRSEQWVLDYFLRGYFLGDNQWMALIQQVYGYKNFEKIAALDLYATAATEDLGVYLFHEEEPKKNSVSNIAWYAVEHRPITFVNEKSQTVFHLSTLDWNWFER